MADITLSSGNICRPYRSPWGNFPIRGFTISTGISSNLIQLGRVVSLDANTATNGSRILPSSQVAGVVMSTLIIGVAAEAVSSNDSTTATDKVIPVWEANPQVEFRANTQGAVLASSQIGATKALVWDSTLTIHKVDLSNSTALNVRCVVTQLIDAIGDSGGAVVFKFLSGDAQTSTNNMLGLYRG